MLRRRGRAGPGLARATSACGCGPCPCGTTGIRKADHVDAQRRAVFRRTSPASAASPSMTGAIGCSPGTIVEARGGHARRKCVRVVAQPRAQLVAGLDQVEHAQRRRRRSRAARCSRTGTVASAAAASRRSPCAPTCSRPPRRRAPCRACRSGCRCDPCTSRNSGVPRPPSPTKPVACESSTITSAPYFARGRRSRASRAITPSIENTPSVAMSLTRAPARFLQPRLEFVEVVVGVAQALRLAEPDAVDDAGVVQRVADHRVLLVEQRLEEAAVRVEARRIQDRVVRAEERAQARLEFLVHALRAADETHRGHAIAVPVDRADARPRARTGDWRARGNCWRTD